MIVKIKLPVFDDDDSERVMPSSQPTTLSNFKVLVKNYSVEHFIYSRGIDHLHPQVFWKNA